MKNSVSEKLSPRQWAEWRRIINSDPGQPIMVALPDLGLEMTPVHARPGTRARGASIRCQFMGWRKDFPLGTERNEIIEWMLGILTKEHKESDEQ